MMMRIMIATVTSLVISWAPSANAQVCIDQRTIASLVSAFSQPSESEPETITLRQRMPTPRPQPALQTHDVNAYLADGVHVPEPQEESAPPSGQDLYNASRANLSRQFEVRRQPKPPAKPVRVPPRQTQTTSTRTTATPQKPKPSQTLTQTVMNQIPNAHCGGICF